MLLEKIQLESDEQILTQVRRHWFVITVQIVMIAFAAILPLPFLLLVDFYFETSTTITVEFSRYGAEIIFFYSIWLLFMWFSIFNVWTNYYLDIVTITDRRAILINQKGFFRRAVTSFRLERLQDMNIEINGIIPTLLDYGNLRVETAGHSDEEFYATDLPKPRELKGLIQKAADRLIGSDPKHDGIEPIDNDVVA